MSENFAGAVAYCDGAGLRAAYVVKEDKNKLQLKLGTGKDIKIPVKNVAMNLSGISSEAEFLSRAEALDKKIIDNAAEVDLPMLWEMMEGEGPNFLIDELADFYFGDEDVFLKAGLFQALCTDIVYFKRRGLEFTIREADQVQAIIASNKKKAEKEAYESRLRPWVEMILKLGKDAREEVPEEFKPFANQLSNFLWTKSKSDSVKLLDALIGKAPIKDKVFEVLMKTGQLPEDVDNHLVMAGVRPDFSERIREAGNQCEIKEDLSRTILPEDFFCYSIDDASTRDVDDVLSLEADGDGWKVGIHIADVSAFVQQGDDLDKEGFNRGTSIYLPTCTVNMFPPELSINKASLLPGSARPAMSFYAQLSATGDLTSWKVEKSMLKVSRKLSYQFCDELLDEVAEGEELLAGELEILDQISKDLRRLREENGAVTFNRPEVKITVKEGDVSVEEVRANSRSRALVGEYMILANQIAALHCARNDVPIIYRTQEISEPRPEMPEEYDPVKFDVAIKCMKKSRLSLHPASHAGLGADFYTQLTSPIRRYTDLVIQRQLSASLAGEELPYTPEELLQVLAGADQSAQVARDVQRSSESYWMHEFMKRHKMDEDMAAIVVANIAGAALVELEGYAMRIRMPSQEKLTLGTKLKVRIVKVNSDRGKIDCELVEMTEEV